jgi:hypothetical protein
MFMEYNTEMVLEDNNPYVQFSTTIFSPQKRKINREGSDDDSNDDVGEVVRKIKRIKFPVYITVKTLNGRSIYMDLDSNDTILRYEAKHATL